MLEKLKDRYVIISISFILIAALMVAKLVDLQVINGKKNDQESQLKLVRERSIVAKRGDIVDRNGIPIAVSRLGFTVQMIKAKMKDDQLNEMLLKLVNIIEKNNDTYYKSLSKYLMINPAAFGSSIANSQKELEKWKKEMAIKPSDVEQMSSPENTFKYMRSKFKIAESYSDEDAYKIMCIRYEMLIRGCTNINPIYVAKDVSRESVAEIEERHDEFPGVTTSTEPVRRYVDAQTEAHVIGYVRGISGEEYNNLKDEGYKMTDVIGKSGIELAAEKYLKGKDGLKTIEEDRWGKQTGELGGNPAIPGNDVVLTLDTKLQKVAMESLKREVENIRAKGGKGNWGDANAGAAVAIDVNSGEVLAMASYPSYDPSAFLEGADNKEAQKYIASLFDPKNEDRPALNRAVQGTYIPGSIFKPITAVAGLEDGGYSPESIIYDPGSKVIADWKFTCLEVKLGLGAHGPLKLDRAMATSCNIYFHEMGYNTGIDNIDKWAKRFGLGELTGIDIPNEAKGTRANKEYKKKAFKDDKDWYGANTAMAAIGQLYHSFTPIQLANYMSTFANGGKKYKPHLIKRVVKYDGSTVMEATPEYEQLPVKPETINAIKPGLIAVTEGAEGTAKDIFKGLPTVAGKTGTPETGNEAKHSSNALFICYAPADNPKIAVVVVIERGVWGANAAPVARDILSEYFDLNKTSNVDDRAKIDEVVFTR
ncbi:MAG: penicillin-binding protein 2 [Clostridia bacterium]|nr:penicillin-binding protein 2 [Clostridia bacterium]